MEALCRCRRSSNPNPNPSPKPKPNPKPNPNPNPNAYQVPPQFSVVVTSTFKPASYESLLQAR